MVPSGGKLSEMVLWTHVGDVVLVFSWDFESDSGGTLSGGKLVLRLKIYAKEVGSPIARFSVELGGSC